MGFDIQSEIERETKRVLADTFAEIVLDRASELITHFDNEKRVQEIANELYELASRRLKWKS